MFWARFNISLFAYNNYNLHVQILGDEVTILLFARVKTGLYSVANTIFAEENFSQISQFPWQLASVLGENLVLKAIIRYRASVRDALVYRKFVKNFAAKIYFQATRLIN